MGIDLVGLDTCPGNIHGTAVGTVLVDAYSVGGDCLGTTDPVAVIVTAPLGLPFAPTVEIALRY